MTNRRAPRRPLRVLFLTSEAHPLVKTGGLGEISGALPVALRELGADVRLLIPGYPEVLARLENAKPVHRFARRHGFPESTLLSAHVPGGVPTFIIESASLYRRPGSPYVDEEGLDWPDNARRFGLLSRVGAILSGKSSPLRWRPQIAHCNDWQTGLAPAYLHYMTGPRAATVMSIHNAAFQGIFPPTTLRELGLPPESFQIDGVEYYGSLSFLKAGLFYADRITTVSPTYSREIQSAPLGFGLQGLLAGRSQVLSGIVNGIDTGVWNPARDALIAAKFSPADLAGKAANKRALQEAMGLEVNPAIPLLGMVSRITDQKGTDLVIDAAGALLKMPAQLAILGSGDHALERTLVANARSHPGAMAVQIGFHEGLAHLIEAGADIFLMPSRFEPCGLNQMYSQLYGTPPVAHATGGLVDTIVDCTEENLAEGTATGFLFTDATAEDLADAVARAVELYRQPDAWRRIQLAGMSRDFSWRASARRYLELYQSLVA
jgi:starch synthase